ncbi:hypothetical protein [Leptobacterium sp. I13]|uniref:hypothetical protein n=1 Tax=Leptobacterium meishanense TaxID=3128904 RepID=UPI0030EDB43A
MYKLSQKELRTINGGGLGRWIAKGLIAVEDAVYNFFNGHYEHFSKDDGPYNVDDAY